MGLLLVRMRVREGEKKKKKGKERWREWWRDRKDEWWNGDEGFRISLLVWVAVGAFLAILFHF